MRKRERPEAASTRNSTDAPVSTAQSKTPWAVPKLKFVEPKLTKQGEMKQITAGFIGTFVPD